MAGRQPVPNLINGEAAIDGKFVRVRVERLKGMDVVPQEPPEGSTAEVDEDNPNKGIKLKLEMSIL
jgi:hypothetical protein